MSIPPGASIGDHGHSEEAEYFIITEGVGIVLDGDQEHPVGPGDVTVTGSGQSHSIRNAGAEPLKFIAVIVTH